MKWKTFSSHTAQESFTDGIRSRCSVRREKDFDLSGFPLRQLDEKVLEFLQRRECGIRSSLRA